MQLIEYNLPEWCYMDGYTHQGDKLKGREVILHIPSMSILEVICLDDKELFIDEGIPSKNFSYNNENFKIVVYKSLLYNADQLINEAIDWYKKEVNFMNKQILNDN